ncbi:beta-lactamase family protein [Aliifodinibius sp. S!AR15-10]|uniref:serine hydrolase domain-containing protein n=1 Tax=Aliifodinibius sp. S!AR15-10 TaxID=2950437 RepID=UPI002862B6F1|nr:serine hydrolase domain-containing protein [Aliifodinibius sp. S!AR15-10]MDR8394611.1 beta-lactamase family protein [Aliifodinibius sp. S!AR15-10]
MLDISQDPTIHPTQVFSTLARRFHVAMIILIMSVMLPKLGLGQDGSLTSGNVVDTDRLSQVDSVLQRYVEEERIAGAVGLVMHDGEIVYEHAAGWADREARQRMETDAIFRVASQSKAITSTAILMLVEEGKINLEDPVSRWMPTFKETTVAVETDSGRTILPARRAITIKDLLTHTSGISYGGDPLIASLYKEKGLGYGETYGWYFADDKEPICDSMDKLGTLPFVAQPGSDWVYGYNTDILGCVVERASGLPLDEFFRKRITGPLGMDDTHFFLPPEKEDRLAAVYTPREGGEGVVRAVEGPKGQGHYVDGPRRSFSGGAGLLSTARDYARFLEMIRNGGALDGKRYLSPHTVAVMTSNQVGNLFSDDGMGFGLGFETTERMGANGFTSVGTFGWSGAYGSDYEVDPKEKLVTVLMIQVVPYWGSGIRESFESAVYQALVPAEQ